MKTLIAVLLLVTSFVTGTLKADIDSGLVASYNFSGNYIDASGHGHNGTPIRNPLFVNDRFNNQSSALSLNGDSQYVSLPSTIKLFIFSFPSYLPACKYAIDIWNAFWQAGGLGTRREKLATCSSSLNNSPPDIHRKHIAGFHAALMIGDLSGR